MMNTTLNKAALAILRSTLSSKGFKWSRHNINAIADNIADRIDLDADSAAIEAQCRVCAEMFANSSMAILNRKRAHLGGSDALDGAGECIAYLWEVMRDSNCFRNYASARQRYEHPDFCAFLLNSFTHAIKIEAVSKVQNYIDTPSKKSLYSNRFKAAVINYIAEKYPERELTLGDLGKTANSDVLNDIVNKLHAGVAPFEFDGKRATGHDVIYCLSNTHSVNTFSELVNENDDGEREFEIADNRNFLDAFEAEEMLREKLSKINQYRTDGRLKKITYAKAMAMLTLKLVTAGNDDWLDILTEIGWVGRSKVDFKRDVTELEKIHETKGRLTMVDIEAVLKVNRYKCKESFEAVVKLP